VFPELDSGSQPHHVPDGWAGREAWHAAQQDGAAPAHGLEELDPLLHVGWSRPGYVGVAVLTALVLWKLGLLRLPRRRRDRCEPCDHDEDPRPPPPE
jgi:hypothetical protein